MYAKSYKRFLSKNKISIHLLKKRFCAKIKIGNVKKKKRGTYVKQKDAFNSRKKKIGWVF